MMTELILQKSLGSGKYGLYAGDVNQDGTVDIVDGQVAENDGSGFAYGYNASDCDGDGETGILDYQLIENNSGLFLYFSRPL